MKTAYRTKYNVKKDKCSRTYNGIIFDSELEMKFFRDYILPLHESGEIESYELQRSYELQSAYERDGKKVRPIVYKSDFELTMADGTHLTIDIKGMLKPLEILKHKILLHKYPELDFRLIGFSKLDGGWVSIDKITAGRKARKKLKEKMEE